MNVNQEACAKGATPYVYIYFNLSTLMDLLFSLSLSFSLMR
jgi:hypothetical protein